MSEGQSLGGFFRHPLPKQFLPSSPGRTAARVGNSTMNAACRRLSNSTVAFRPPGLLTMVRALLFPQGGKEPAGSSPYFVRRLHTFGTRSRFFIEVNGKPIFARARVACV